MVVQREKENYGITLAEAQPVFVQKTSKDGPADRAGIQPGDRIIKVCVCLCVLVCACVDRGVLFLSEFFSHAFPHMPHTNTHTYTYHTQTHPHPPTHPHPHPHTHTHLHAMYPLTQVNGTSIMNKSHLEVVGMIKKSSFVSLTLMRKISGDESRHRSEWREQCMVSLMYCRYTYLRLYLCILSI